MVEDAFFILPLQLVLGVGRGGHVNHLMNYHTLNASASPREFKDAKKRLTQTKR